MPVLPVYCWGWGTAWLLGANPEPRDPLERLSRAGSGGYEVWLWPEGQCLARCPGDRPSPLKWLWPSWQPLSFSSRQAQEPSVQGLSEQGGRGQSEESRGLGDSSWAQETQELGGRCRRRGGGKAAGFVWSPSPAAAQEPRSSLRVPPSVRPASGSWRHDPECWKTPAKGTEGGLAGIGCKREEAGAWGS